MSNCPGVGLVWKTERGALGTGGNEFDVLVTIDTNLRYQQNMTGRRIAIVILRAHSNRLEDLSQHFTACAKAIENIKPGDLINVGGLA